MSGSLVYSVISSPIGGLLVAATGAGVCFLEFGADDDSVAKFRKWADRHLAGNSPVRDDSALQDVTKQLDEYFAGLRTRFDLELDLRGTEFQRSVWLELTHIPYGEVRSYKQIAEAIGMPKAVRAVGGANNRNPLPIIVPCHRVIGSNGSLVGYGGGLSIKEHLLALEGYLTMSKASNV